MKRHRVLCAVVVNLAAWPAVAEIATDGFEDGDYTSNPAWVVGRDVGGAAVEPDPWRSGNLALKMCGTESAHRTHLTAVSTSYDAFVFEIECAAATANFGPMFRLGTAPGHNIGMRLVPDGADTLWLFALDAGSSAEWLAKDPDAPTIPAQPVAEWWRIRLWHDACTAGVQGEIRRVSDDSLVCVRACPDSDPLPSYPIGNIYLEAEENDWQYFDNVMLDVPEPGSLALLCAAGVPMLLRRRPGRS